VTSRVVTNRDLAASRCRVEERPHRERHESIAEHADEEPFEDKGIRCVQEGCAEASSQRSVHWASDRHGADREERDAGGAKNLRHQGHDREGRRRYQLEVLLSFSAQAVAATIGASRKWVLRSPTAGCSRVCFKAARSSQSGTLGELGRPSNRRHRLCCSAADDVVFLGHVSGDEKRLRLAQA
jgi:hypothetical protein